MAGVRPAYSREKVISKELLRDSVFGVPLGLKDELITFCGQRSRSLSPHICPILVNAFLKNNQVIITSVTDVPLTQQWTDLEFGGHLTQSFSLILLQNCTSQQRNKRSVNQVNRQGKQAAVVSAGPVVINTRVKSGVQPSHCESMCQGDRPDAPSRTFCFCLTQS